MLGQVTYTNKKRPINNVGKIDAVDNAEIANKMIHESVRSITSRSRSGIQSTQIEFRLIRFNDGKRSQTREPVGDKDVMANVADIDVDNRLPLKTIVEYEWGLYKPAK